MKKLLTMLLAIGLGSVASAASVDWSVASKSFTTSDGSSERAKNYLVCVFLQSDYANVVSALSAVDGAAVASAFATGSYVKSQELTGNNGSTGGTFTTSEASGTMLTLFTVAFNADTIAGATYYTISSSADSQAYEAPSTPSKTADYNSSSYSAWKKIEPIPEPSVAIMGLLGIGMLLKRRRA
jgi:hypothetical protein